MQVEQFSETLIKLNNTIDKYLKANRAKEYVAQNQRVFNFPDEVFNFLMDIIIDRIQKYEKEIITQSLALTQKNQE